MTTRQNLSNSDFYLRMGYRFWPLPLFSQGAVASCWTLNHCQILRRTMGASNFTLVGQICLWYARLTSLQHKSIFGHFWPPSPSLFSSLPSITSPSSNLVLPPSPLSHCLRDSWQRQGQLHTPLQLLVAPLLAASSTLGLWMLKIWVGESGKNLLNDASVWKKLHTFTH